MEFPGISLGMSRSQNATFCGAGWYRIGHEILRKLQLKFCSTASDGEVAAVAEQKKLTKYDSLAPNYDIAPVAIESLGAIGPLSRALLKDLGRRIKESTGEARAHEYTSCSVWQLQFSEEMLFPSWARWETLHKSFLGSILCLCL